MHARGDVSARARLCVESTLSLSSLCPSFSPLTAVCALSFRPVLIADENENENGKIRFSFSFSRKMPKNENETGILFRDPNPNRMLNEKETHFR